MAFAGQVRTTLPPEVRNLADIIRNEMLATEQLIERRTQRDVRQRLREIGVTGSRELIDSVKVAPVIARTQLASVIASTAVQAYFVEYGRRPDRKQPPTDAILRWMGVKGIGRGLKDYQQRGLAFVIARKIGREGFPGRFPFRDTLQALRPWIADQLAQAVRRITKQFN
ncbi:MAG: hypothetical protein U0Z53_29045 [Blastocatellia bacterium]